MIQLFLLVVPPTLLLVAYFISVFPHPPEPVPVRPSLAHLPETSKHWAIYPEDFLPGGDYATLPYGRVRYWLLGPEEGKKVVLIHGLSIPSLVWEEAAPNLAARGYRVLVYDIYGRGYSDAPLVHYNAEFMSTQLALLLQYIQWPKVNVVGVSMGGGVAAAFTRLFPRLVDDKIALICSAGLIEPHHMSRTVKLMSNPLIQKILTFPPFTWYIRRLATTRAASTLPSDPFEEIVRLQSAYLPGYNQAVASSLRDGPITGQESSFSSAGFENRSVLLMHGTEDNTVPFQHSHDIKALLPPSASSKMITIQGGGHAIIMKNTSEVCKELADFLG